MSFWIATALITAAVAGLLFVSLRRGGAQQAEDAADYDLRVYRDQLSEIDRDVARGVLEAEDAERVRTEVARRILAADKARSAAASGAERSPKGAVILGAVLTAVLGIGSFGIYTKLGAPGYGDLALADRIAAAEILRTSRPDQDAAEASLTDADLPPSSPQSPDYIALVEQLREVVAQRPNDVQGLRLLAISERNLGNYAEAHRAFGTYLNLRGDDANAAEIADYADMLVLAAGGYVSPQAEAALRQALSMEPSNGPARYYYGLMRVQTGRPDLGFRLWDQLLREGPPDAPWIPPIQAQIEEAALRAGVDYSMPAPGGGRGPSQDDINAASEMTASERMDMIAGMVSGLSDRLATEGGPPQDWARLITSLGVLGRRDDAFNVYANALQVFDGDATALDIINRAGDQAGVAN